jgi:hypothetical protein
MDILFIIYFYTTLHVSAYKQDLQVLTDISQKKVKLLICQKAPEDGLLIGRNM